LVNPAPVLEPECITVPVPQRQKVAVAAAVPQHWLRILDPMPFCPGSEIRDLGWKNPDQQYRLGCALTFASEAKFEIEAKKKPDFS
jgi:hypothetical protein